ncbi:hypothetical protein, partial [Paracoccus sp. (in: a-proteobacteria)]|uniref:hypothetical protein n=1 Tax=Paracoccus sp. TaxID=267 RepID=UPI0040586B35
LTSAYVAGVSARIDVTDAALANIPQGRMTAQPLAMGAVQENGLHKLPGAFRIWTSWTLSNPLDNSRIAQLEGERTKLP